VAELYDGFISYSHAADDLLAPRLQSALQRFAKPWWKRRAVRIFRDESSLSANPHLWSSITEALDTSGWFVLLLSPDAARSEWVNQEIAYWVENRDPKKILPVVTDGEFGWDGSGVTGDAVPESLRGVFSEEPRWVDVRWAKPSPTSPPPSGGSPKMTWPPRRFASTAEPSEPPGPPAVSSRFSPLPPSGSGSSHLETRVKPNVSPQSSGLASSLLRRSTWSRETRRWRSC
jgi:hypothetical protein